MPFSTFMDNAILNEFFGGTDYTPPATLYIGLSTTTPSKTGTGVTEPTGGAYKRVAIANTVANFPNASNGSKNNGTVITFPEATANWGTLTHFVIYDAVTGGNMLVYGALVNAKSIEPGDVPSFNTGTLNVSLAQ